MKSREKEGRLAVAAFDSLDDDVHLVGRVRAFVTEQLRALRRDDLTDDAVLVASELATNAVLHAGGIAAVRVEPMGDRVRIEVHDRTRVPPVMTRASPEAMTGRGLRLVASLSTNWAVEPTPAGKVVWAELSDGPPLTTAISDDALLEIWDDASWPEDEQAPVRYAVSLGAVPTPLLLAAKSHVDNLVREFTLAARGAQSGVTAELPPHLARLIETVATRFAEARQEIKRQAATAANAGLSHVRLELNLPADAADAAEDYLRALDEADSYCRAARLLTLETPPQHRVFRHWYVGELVTQLRAAAAGTPAPPAQSFEDRLLQEIDVAAKAQLASERAARLYQVSAALASAATQEAVATAVLEQGVAALRASGGGILLATDVDRLVTGTVGYDDEVVERLRAESRDAELPAAVALRTGESVWIESREERDRRFPELSNVERRTVSLCAVPLVVGDRRLGAVGFSFPRPRLFDEDERRFVLALAAQTAQALDRAQLYEQRLDFSRRLQLSLLPRRLVGPPSTEVAGVYHSLGDGMELGGDIYDVWPIGDGRWAIAIADASGTGPEAAALSAMVRFTLRALTVSEPDPASVLAKLNQALLAADVAGLEGERFCTTLLGVVSPGPTVALASGGHPLPLLRRPDGRVEEIAVGGSLLGVFDDAPIGSATVSLQPGETLVMYTDGAVEARRGGVMFGVEGVVAAIKSAGAGASAIAHAIEQAVLDHTGGIVSDDLAALVVHVPD